MSDTTLAASQPAPLAGRPSRPKPIIAAVGAREGATVLAAADLVARRSGGALTVLSVVEPLALYSYGPEAAVIPPGLIEVQRASRLELVQKEVTLARRGAEEAPEWPVEVLYGEPPTTIAREAEVLGAQLVVMGIGPHKPINRLLATETTLATIRRVRCPVLAVAGELSALPRTVVVATDFSPACIHAAARALPLLADGATMFLVHAWSRSGMSHPDLQEADDAYERGLPARFDRLRGALNVPPSVTLTPVELVGKPVDEILEFARGHGADLVVAGTHGRGLVERLFVGSVATALLRGAACSLLISPEPPLAERSRIERHMTGTSSSRSPEEWAGELEEFARRNRGRRTRLEVDDQRLGAQVQESGYALLGATYDPHDRHVELMLGGPAGGAAHLTRGIARVRSVAVLSGAEDRDEALSIENEDGQTLLTFPSR